MGLVDSNEYEVPSALTKERPCELIKVGTRKGHWPQPLLPISQLQDCTKGLPFTYGLLRAMWAWWIVISMKYHQLWRRKRSCELIEVGTSKGHWPQPLLSISQLQDCTKSLPFTCGLCTSVTDRRFFICKIVLEVFLSPMDYAPLFTDFSFARLY